MAFVHYRSPDPRPGHRGESLRTKSVVDAWTRVRRFLAECTDDPSPRSVTLRLDRAVDDDGTENLLLDELTRDLGPSTEWRSSSGDELAWEWNDAALLERVVAACARYEALPRIHVNPAVRRHESPKTPRVSADIAFDIQMRCGIVDNHVYKPGWGQSQFRVSLGYNEIWAVLHLPFSDLGADLESAVSAIEAALDHDLSRKRLKLHMR